MCRVPFIHCTSTYTHILTFTHFLRLHAVLSYDRKKREDGDMMPLTSRLLSSSCFLESLFRYQFRLSTRSYLNGGSDTGIRWYSHRYLCGLLTIFLTGLQLTTPLDGRVGN